MAKWTPLQQEYIRFYKLLHGKKPDWAIPRWQKALKRKIQQLKELASTAKKRLGTKYLRLLVRVQRGYNKAREKELLRQKELKSKYVVTPLMIGGGVVGGSTLAAHLLAARVGKKLKNTSDVDLW